jgi:hypothetical protein
MKTTSELKKAEYAGLRAYNGSTTLGLMQKHFLQRDSLPAAMVNALCQGLKQPDEQRAAQQRAATMLQGAMQGVGAAEAGRVRAAAACVVLDVMLVGGEMDTAVIRDTARWMAQNGLPSLLHVYQKLVKENVLQHFPGLPAAGLTTAIAVGQWVAAHG